MAQPPTGMEDEDELDLEPDELNERRDPGLQLATKRANALNTLKSRFEEIIAKYEKDFSHIGDEIDLATGEVVVDNGHLSSLDDMKDWIVDDDDDQEDEDEDEDERREATLPVSNTVGMRHENLNGVVLKDPWRLPEPSSTSESVPQGCLPPNVIWSHPFSSERSDGSALLVAHEPSVSADPAWQAPELPPSAFLRNTLRSDGCSKGRHYGSGTPVDTRMALRCSLPAPESREADGVDDLQGLPGDAPATAIMDSPQGDRRNRISRLVNKFPTVDSSPRNNDLTHLIQDVIENIPATPPSIRPTRLAKSQGKPSSLSQKAREHLGAKSKLRISDTPLQESNQGSANKQGRLPMIHVESTMEEEKLSDPIDQPSWDASDLESYVDVTCLENIKPLGQALYIDIRVSKHYDKGSKGNATANECPNAPTKDTCTDGVVAGTIFHQVMSEQQPKAFDHNFHHVQTENAAIISSARMQHKAVKSGPQEIFTRNAADPDFYFSDEETLLPRRRTTNKRQSEPAKLTSAPPHPIPESRLSTQDSVGDHTHAIAESRQAAFEWEVVSNLQHPINLGAEAAGRASAEVPLLGDSVLSILPTPSTSALGPVLECDFQTPDGIREFDQPQALSLATQPVSDSGHAVPHGLPNSLHRRTRSSAWEPPPKEVLPDQAHQVETETNIPVEEPTSEAVTTQKSRQRRRSERFSSKSHLARKVVDLRIRNAEADKGTRAKSDMNTPAISPAFNLATTHHSSAPTDHKVSTRGFVSKDSTSTGREALHTEQDVALGFKELLPVAQEIDQRAAEADTGLSRPVTRSAVQPDKDLQRSSTEIRTAVNPTDAVEYARASTPGTRCGMQSQPRRRPSTRGAQGTKRTAEEASLDAEAEHSEALQPEVAQERTDEAGQSAALSSPAVSGPSPPAEHPASQPETPRRPRPREGRKKKKETSSSFDTSLISMLSDSDDSEDEISFDHSDFTPSGHHRILVHRSLSRLLPTTTAAPRRAAPRSATTKRTGSLYDRSHHPASAHKGAKTPSPSFDTSLISLLSDADDSEDEISFHHSDFTLSSHHRLLVHRSLPQTTTTTTTTTTPRRTAPPSATTKRAGSLLYGRAHRPASARKGAQTPRSAPRTEASRRRHGSSGGGGGGSRQLARSVVRVARRRDSAGDHAGSVVQTPGGTERRCGAAGWKCDRDICFVCM